MLKADVFSEIERIENSLSDIRGKIEESKLARVNIQQDINRMKPKEGVIKKILKKLQKRKKAD